MSIEKLYTMPSHTKGDGGYFYDNKYVNKLFQFENKLIYFTENTFQELPLELYNTITKECDEKINIIINDIDNLNNIVKESETSTESNIEIRFKELEEKIKKIAIKVASTQAKIQEIENILTNLNNIDEKTINSMIDKKLEAVYNSFEKLSEKFVKDNINTALKDSKREASGKLKVSSLAIFKEMGYSPSEIRELADSGLI